MTTTPTSWSVIILLLFTLIVVNYEVTGGEPRYRCPDKRYIRLANSCYFLSSEITSWQEAHFRCRDQNAQLAVLATEYEDSSLRSYLERRELAQLGRWLGGMWASDRWIWAAQGTDIDNPRAFVSANVQYLPYTDQWMCLYMDPRNRYRWSNENCIRQLHYICEAPLMRNTNNNSQGEAQDQHEDHDEDDDDDENNWDSDF